MDIQETYAEGGEGVLIHFFCYKSGLQLGYILSYSTLGVTSGFVMYSIYCNGLYSLMWLQKVPFRNPCVM